MDHPDFRAANFDTGFIDRILPELDSRTSSAPTTHARCRLAAAAIIAFEEAQNVRLPEETRLALAAGGALEAMRGRD